MSDDICPICKETVSFLSRTAVDGVICHTSCSLDYRAQLSGKSIAIADEPPSAKDVEMLSPKIPRSSSAAIETLSTISVVVLVVGLVGALLFLIIGIASSASKFGAVSLAVIVCIFTLIQWSVIRVFVGIAQDVRAIRKSTEDD